MANTENEPRKQGWRLGRDFQVGSGSELPHNVDEFTPDTFDFECYINFPGTELVCDAIRKIE